MSDHDRIERLDAAAELIFVLRSCGCTQQFIAAYLGIGHSKLSRWNRTVEDSSRKSGVPSTEQLRKLATLVQRQLSDNLTDAFECLHALEFRPAGEHLWYALEFYQDEVAKKFADAKEHRDKLDETARKLTAAVGNREARRMLRPEAVSRSFSEAEDHSESMQEAHAKASAADAAEQESKRVTREDAAADRRALAEWCKTHDEKIRERRIRKRHRQSRANSDEG
jgi:transcriptional regulator with XRE-family HTH domain